MSTWQERLREEEKELAERFDKLSEFLRKDSDIDQKHERLLIDQSIYMRRYLDVLRQRLDLIGSHDK